MNNQTTSSERETPENREPSHVGLSALLGDFSEVRQAAKFVVKMAENGMQNCDDAEDITGWKLVGVVANEYLKLTVPKFNTLDEQRRIESENMSHTGRPRCQRCGSKDVERERDHGDHPSDGWVCVDCLADVRC